MKVTFLGTGTSHGVPMIGCDCSVCRSENPKNTRSRSSILLSKNGKNILVDASTDMRMQALRANILHVEAIILTHTHADHVFGLDDIRRYNAIQKASIPLYADALSIEGIRKTYYYIFEQTQEGGGKPQIEIRHISEDALEVCGIPVLPLPVLHGELAVKGYRFGKFAYVTDCSYIPDETLEKMEGLDVLVLGALKKKKHKTHFSLSEALDVVEKLKPKRAFFTHICHELEHEAINEELPPYVRLAYDGQVLEI